MPTMSSGFVVLRIRCYFSADGRSIKRMTAAVPKLSGLQSLSYAGDLLFAHPEPLTRMPPACLVHFDPNAAFPLSSPISRSTDDAGPVRTAFSGADPRRAPPIEAFNPFSAWFAIPAVSAALYGAGPQLSAWRQVPADQESRGSRAP